MEEKKKYTPKEESPDYGLTGDDCRPFSEDAGIRRLQNAFGEALGDLPPAGRDTGSMDSFLATTGAEETTSISPHMAFRWHGSSYCPALNTVVTLE